MYLNIGYSSAKPVKPSKIIGIKERIKELGLDEHKLSNRNYYKKSKYINKHLNFVLDHIDGNASNNRENNLRLICPNCDSQLDTYKSKNKNSARQYR